MNIPMRVYRKLMTNPGDRTDMLVLADALEDAGATNLALAYQWAANYQNGDGKVAVRWPFQRRRREGFVYNNPVVYDWDTQSREAAPEPSRLPVWLYRRMCDDRPKPEARYGSVNRAFKLLAKFLPQYLKENS